MGCWGGGRIRDYGKCTLYSFVTPSLGWTNIPHFYIIHNNVCLIVFPIFLCNGKIVFNFPLNFHLCNIQLLQFEFRPFLILNCIRSPIAVLQYSSCTFRRFVQRNKFGMLIFFCAFLLKFFFHSFLILLCTFFIWEGEPHPQPPQLNALLLAS